MKRMVRRLSQLVILIGLVEPGLARTVRLADVPFERAFAGIPFVKVRVNGSEPLQFLIDTGGGGSIIDRDVARSLGLRVVQGRASVSGDASLDVGVVPNATIGIGKATIETHLSVNSLRALEPSFGRRIDGILGGDFFEHYVVEFNYDSDRARVYDTYDWNGEGSVLPITITQGVPFVALELRIQSQELSGRFLIDSGGGFMAIHLHRQIADLHGLTSRGGLGESGLGMGGRTKRVVLRGETLVIGRDVFDAPPVAITDDTAGLRTDPDSLGLVGIEVLRNFDSVFDYRARTLYLRRSRQFSRRLLYDASGMNLRAAPPRYAPAMVSGVVVSSPAAEAGVEAGDVLVEIDRKMADDLSLEDVRETFRRPGIRHAITVARQGQRIRLVLVTRELL